MKKTPYDDSKKSLGLFMLALSILEFVLAYTHGLLPTTIQEVIKYAIH